MQFKHFAVLTAAFLAFQTLLSSSWLGRDTALTGNLYGVSDNLYAIGGLGFLVAYLYACRWPVAGLINMAAIAVGWAVIVGLAVIGLPGHRIYGVDAFLFSGWGVWIAFVTISVIIPNVKDSLAPMPVPARLQTSAWGLLAVLGIVAVVVGVSDEVLKEVGGSVALIYAACLVWGLVVGVSSRRYMSARPWA